VAGHVALNFCEIIALKKCDPGSDQRDDDLTLNLPLDRQIGWLAPRSAPRAGQGTKNCPWRAVKSAIAQMSVAKRSPSAFCRRIGEANRSPAFLNVFNLKI
jgi:hypothetical protein